VNEYEIRELCEQFFDAYENKRADILDHLYSDDCIIWHNVFGRDIEMAGDAPPARSPDAAPARDGQTGS